MPTGLVGDHLARVNSKRKQHANTLDIHQVPAERIQDTLQSGHCLLLVG
jgi:hypothetical protein